jgi:hypothetical protein
MTKICIDQAAPQEFYNNYVIGTNTHTQERARARFLNAHKNFIGKPTAHLDVQVL